MLRRLVEPGQYTSWVFGHRLREAGPVPSVGTVGDNALAVTTIGLFKPELFKPRGPWRTPEQVEIALLEWVDWYSHHRLHEHCADITPVELEAAH